MTENKTKAEILKEEIISNLEDFDFEDGSCFTPEELSEALIGVNKWARNYFAAVGYYPKNLTDKEIEEDMRGLLVEE